VGRDVPPAPGRRRLHDADQGPRRGDDRAAGPRDRRGGRRLRRGTRRQPGLRQPLRRPHDPTGHPAALDPHRRRAPDLAALLGRRPDHRAGLRRLGPQRVLVPGVGHRRRRRWSTPSGGPGHLRLLHRQPRVRQPAPQVQDRGHGLPRGLRPRRDQRHRPVAGRAGDGTIGFNVLIGGGLSDGERMASDIDVFIRPDQAVELCRGSPSSSASWATGRTAAWPACATWPRSSVPRDSGPPWTSARSSPWSRRAAS
jgi:hypothetical protein